METYSIPPILMSSHTSDKIRLLQTCSEFSPSSATIALSIGNFDGVHLGHQTLLKKMRSLGGDTLILTFSNHPGTILYGSAPPLLTTLHHKLSLLEKEGVDALIALPFTLEFAEQSAERFLTTLHKELPFTHLILGHDAVIGHNRTGTQERVSALADHLHFHVEYLPPFKAGGEVISSSRIRTHIQQGQLEDAAQLLGRPYSFEGLVTHGAHRGEPLGFRTANLAVDEVVLPPLGVYVVEIETPSKNYTGVANLGHAPTLHTNRKILLEAHLLDCDENLYGQRIKVSLKRYLRPEKRFSSPEALKAQITADIASIKK